MNNEERDKQAKINAALARRGGIVREFLQEKPIDLSSRDLERVTQGSYGDFDWDPDSIPSNQAYAFIAEQKRRVRRTKQKLLALRAVRGSGEGQGKGFIRTEQGGVVSYDVNPRNIAYMKHLAVGSAGSTSRRKDRDM